MLGCPVDCWSLKFACAKVDFPAGKCEAGAQPLGPCIMGVGSLYPSRCRRHRGSKAHSQQDKRGGSTRVTFWMMCRCISGRSGRGSRPARNGDIPVKDIAALVSEGATKRRSGSGTVLGVHGYRQAVSAGTQAPRVGRVAPAGSEESAGSEDRDHVVRPGDSPPLG